MVRIGRLLQILAVLLVTLAVGACASPTSRGSGADPGRARVVKPAVYEVQPNVPPYVTLRYMFAVRPVDDSGLNKDLWRTCDETVLPIDVLARLRGAGFRVGVLSGQPPETLDILLREVPEGAFNGHELRIPSNRVTLIQVGARKKCPQQLAALLDSAEEQVTHPTFVLKTVPTLHGDDSVDLHIVPVVQYGNITRQYVPEFGPGGVRQWTFENKRAEREFGDLAFQIRIRPDQTLLLTCDPSRSDTLAWMMFVDPTQLPPRQTLLVIQVAKHN